MGKKVVKKLQCKKKIVPLQRQKGRKKLFIMKKNDVEKKIAKLYARLTKSQAAQLRSVIVDDFGITESTFYRWLKNGCPTRAAEWVINAALSQCGRKPIY